MGEESWLDVKKNNLCDDAFHGISSLAFLKVHFLVELLQESVVLGSICLLHFVLSNGSSLAERRLEFPTYWAVLLCLSFSFIHLLVGVHWKELTFRVKNCRVGHDEWFLPPPCFPKILGNTHSGLYYRGHPRLMHRGKLTDSWGLTSRVSS